MGDVVLYLPATSPMWEYNPGNINGGWIEDKGRRLCAAGAKCVAEIPNVQCESSLKAEWSMIMAYGASQSDQFYMAKRDE